MNMKMSGWRNCAKRCCIIAPYSPIYCTMVDYSLFGRYDPMNTRNGGEGKKEKGVGRREKEVGGFSQMLFFFPFFSFFLLPSSFFLFFFSTLFLFFFFFLFVS